MDCPSCGHENRPGAALCGECGASLPHEVVCPGCGTSNPRNQRFCDKCGTSLAAAEAQAPTASPQKPASPSAYTPSHLAEKILRERPSLEGERRTVTVLFADAMGFT